MPLFDPGASEQEPSPARSAARFMIWPRDQRGTRSRRGTPARGHAIATYQAPSTDLRLIGPLAWKSGIPGYPDTVLYRLPADCPPRPLQVAR